MALGETILIETHALNKQGFDNSGRRGSANWADDQRNVDRTRGVVQSLASEFSNGQYYGVVTAIVSDPFEERWFAGVRADNFVYTGCSE